LRNPPSLSSAAPPTPGVGASGSIAGAAVYPVEVDGQLFDLMRFGELKDTKTGDRQAVAPAAKFFVTCHSSGI
jgi:hypothetical protein